MEAVEFKDAKQVEDYIGKQIILFGSNKPSVIIFGRGKINSTYRCIFDESKSAEVFKIDVSLLSLPDRVFDFNNALLRRKHLKEIAAKTCPVLCIFDWSVFKNVTNPDEFFGDVANILPKGCMFVFPFEVRGGIITLMESTDTKKCVEDLNVISIPYPTSKENYEITKARIMAMSKDLILANLMGSGKQ